MRKGSYSRRTSETDVFAEIEVDGSGRSRISTPVPFFDHMLELFSYHGLFDLALNAQGDVERGAHHLLEDAGYVLGKAFDSALGDRSGIARYGHQILPMDESLARVAVDIGGRPYLVFKVNTRKITSSEFDGSSVQQFFYGFSCGLACNLHVAVLYGTDPHHMLEAVFKAFGRAMRDATRIEEARDGAPSTKGCVG